MTVLEAPPAPPAKARVPMPVPPTNRSAPTGSKPGRTSVMWVVMGLLGAVLLVYGQTLDFGFITFDDENYVTDNPQLKQGLTWGAMRWAWTTFASANWHPLTWMSLLLDFQLYGLNPGGYHLTNVLLHVATTVGVFLWLRAATGAFWRPALVAGLFALHPLHVESVAWVSERKDVLCALFFVATLAAYTRWARQGGAGNYALALGLYALGLSAKPMLVTLPAVLLLLDAWPLNRLGAENWRTALRRRLGEKAPFFALTLASCVVTFVAQRDGGAVVPLVKLTLGQRLANAVLGYGDYLWLTAFPRHLSIFYPRHEEWSALEVIAAATVLLLITALAVRAWRTTPAVLVGWAWFVGMLVPVIGLVQVGGQAMADRYTYLPHLGLFTALVWGIGALVSKMNWAGQRPGRLTLGGAAAALLLACGMQAWEQAGNWRNSFTLYQRSLERTGPTLRMCQLLGDAAIESRHFTEADRWLQRALRLAPGEAHVIMQLGTVRMLQGRWAEAVPLIGAALPKMPNNAVAHNNFALAVRRAGGGHEVAAARAYERSLEIQPADATVRCSLAELRQEMGNGAEAIRQYELVLALRPDWPDVLLRLGFLRATCPDPAARDGRRALACVQRAAALIGGNVRGGLDGFAAAYAELGQWPLAVAAGEAALHAAEEETSADSQETRQRREWLELYRAGKPLRL